MSINRRNLLKLGAVSVAAAATLAGCNKEPKPAKEISAKGLSAGVGSKAPLHDAKGPRVVVVGGGWSGLSVAKNTKKFAPNADVILVEQRSEFVSCPLSNLWIVDELELETLIHDYIQAARENNYTYFNATVVGVDKTNKTIQTSNGDIDYDYLVLAPGIDYDYSLWTKGDIAFENRLRTEYPAGFIPGSEHITLRNKVLDFEEGNFILTVPAGNYRCLPAPYERACMIADYFIKEEIKGKVILLDENESFTIKAEGFSSVFKELYADYIEYVPNAVIESIDLDKKIVKTEFDDYEFADAAFYPHVRGAKLLEIAGVAKDSSFNKLEGNIDQFNYSVIGEDNIFVSGDARPMGFSKSGNTSNSEGRYVAKVIAGRINNKKVEWESPLTICYSVVSTNPQRAINVKANYIWDKEIGGFNFTNATSNEEWRGKSGVNTAKGLHEWAAGMYRNMFSS